MITECLEAAGVENVIWIDDKFAPRSRERCYESIENCLRMLHENSEERTIVVENLGELNLDVTVEALVEDFDTRSHGLDNPQLVAAAESIEKLAGIEIEPRDGRDLSDEEFSVLAEGMGSRLTKLCLAEWTSEGSTKFASADRKTLFIIDKEFTREGGTMDGLEILKELAGGDAFCVMFTGHCVNGQEEQKRRHYSREKGISPHRFSVISKVSGTDVAERFGQALRGSFIHRQTGELAELIRDVLGKSAEEVSRDLMAQSLVDIDQAIFQNSISEGASELDVLLRIFFLRQKDAAQRSFQDQGVRDALLKMRKFRKTIAEQLERDPKPSMEQFREWRRLEVTEDGKAINAIHSPLRCGDIFDCSNEDAGVTTVKSYILLAQPCDLMVREKDRIAEAGLFVLLTETAEDQTRDTRNGSRFHEISGVLPDNKVWRADFLQTFVVDLSVLDCAVFNPGGQVELTEFTQVPEGFLTDGYVGMLAASKRALIAMLALRPPGSPKPLSLGKRGNKYRGKLEQRRLAYPIIRTKRLESNIAQSVLAAWATYQTRAALDHDFARARGAEPALPGPIGEKAAAESKS